MDTNGRQDNETINTRYSKVIYLGERGYIKNGVIIVMRSFHSDDVTVSWLWSHVNRIRHCIEIATYTNRKNQPYLKRHYLSLNANTSVKHLLKP